MRVESFAEIAEEFHARTARIAWAMVATVGADGAPRTRILHPIWTGAADLAPVAVVAAAPPNC